MKLSLPLAVGLATAAASLVVRKSEAAQRVRTAREAAAYQKPRDSLYKIRGSDEPNRSSSSNHKGRVGIASDVEIDLRNVFAEDLDHWDRTLVLLSMDSVQTPSRPPATSPPATSPPATSLPVTSPPVKPPSMGPTPYPSGGTTPYPTVGPTPYPTVGPTPYATGTPPVAPPPSTPPVPPPTFGPSAPPVYVTMAPVAPSTISPMAPPVDVPTVTLAPTASYAPSEVNMTVAPSTVPGGSPTLAPNVNPPILVPATTWQVLIDRSDEFSIFIAASEAVGYDEVLQGDEDMTLFAPNNDAFESLMPADLLEKYFDFELWTEEYILRLLGCHDILGTIIFSFQLQNGTKLLPCLDLIDPAFVITTPPLQISKSTMPVPANIVGGDFLARNGVVHTIDQVMTSSFLRLNLPEMAEAVGAFSILLELVVISGLLEFASGPGPFTLYAPPNSVFESYGQDFLDGLMADAEGTRELLLNHVVPDLIVPCCLPDGSQFVSAAGFPVTIDNVDPEDPTNYTVNGASTVLPFVGLMASNAMVNTIDDILFLPVSGGPSQAPGTDSPPPTLASNTTWDIIKSRPEEFATFIAASEAVGFDAFLSEDTDSTVFVPNEEAFQSIEPPDLLVKYFSVEVWTKEYIEALLFCHELTDVVVLSSDLENGTKITPCVDLIDPFVLVTLPPPTLSKTTMPIPADIVEVDLLANNGVVHVIDQVLTNSFLRFDLVEASEAVGTFNILLELLEITDLLDFAMADGPFTVFAPFDEVFESYGQEFVDSLKADPEGTRTILLNHVVPDVIVPCCLGNTTEFTSAAGFTLVLDDYSPNNPSAYSVNGVPTVPEFTDLLTSNAKVNTISDILFLPIDSTPPSKSPSLAPALTSGSPSLAPALMSASISPSLAPALASESISPSLAPALASESISPSLSPALAVENVWDVILSRPEDFSTYIAACEAVGYDEVLRTSSAITVFVPVELAFGSLMPADLLVKYLAFDVWTQEYIRALLSCHDIDDAVVLSSDLTGGTEFATCPDLIHPEFLFTDPPPQIGIETMPVPADIVEFDLVSANGVVHVVNQVLTTSFLRYNAAEAAEQFGQFTILLELVELTDLIDFFTGPGPFTLFAPPDEVFEKYGEDFIDALRDDPDGTRAILLNHVVPDLIVPCCLTNSTTFQSAAGFPLVLDDIDQDDDSQYSVNGIVTVPGLTNVLVSNAKVNAITDLLLVPPADGDGGSGSAVPSGSPS